jgi:O-antigen ligase
MSQGRLSGGYVYDANDIALICLTAIPMIVWWILDKKSLLGKIMVATIPLLLYVIIKSDSRGGFLGLAALALGFLVLGIKRRKLRGLRNISILAALAFAIGVPFLPSGYLERIRQIGSDQDYNTTSYSGRKNLWRRGLFYARTNPIFGVGLGNFRTAEGRNLAGEATPGVGIKWSAPHNSFIQALAEGGLITGTAFILLVIGSIVQLFRVRPDATGGDLMPSLMGLAMLAFAVTSFFLSWAYYDVTYMLLGLSAGILMHHGIYTLRWRPARASAPRPESARPARRGAGPRTTPAPALRSARSTLGR